jgi:hypothetical protein
LRNELHKKVAIPWGCAAEQYLVCGGNKIFSFSSFSNSIIMFILSIKRQSHNPGGNQVHATAEISERKQRVSLSLSHSFLFLLIKSGSGIQMAFLFSSRGSILHLIMQLKRIKMSRVRALTQIRVQFGQLMGK